MQVQAMETPNKYSPEDLLIFKNIILKKIENAKKQIELYKDAHRNKNSGDGAGSKFNVYQDAPSSSSLELNTHIVTNQEKFIRDLKCALIRIENKSFGVCKSTGKLIDKKRLMVVPHATMSVEEKNARDEQKN